MMPLMSTVSVASLSPLAQSLPPIVDRRGDDFMLGLPHCAVPCVEQLCTPFNQTCVCGPDKSAIDRCVLVSCGIPAATYVRNLTETSCKTPVRDRRVDFNIMTATMTSCTFCVISARLLYKQFLSARRAIDYEDWSLIAAVLIGLPSVFISVFCLTANGMGRDVWGLQHPSLVTTLYYLYINSILYVVLMILIKLSLTFFYLNIFFGRIRILLWATVVFHVISATVYVLGVVFQCLPIGYAWEKFDYAKDEPAHGHCLNINVAGWVNSGISVAADIWLLSLPLSQLHKMRLHWKKKLGATLMFMTGASVTLISCLRLASIRNYATTSNPTWDQWDILWWSTVEVEVGLICICLPTIRLIFIRIAPRIFGSESSSVSITLNHIDSQNTKHTRLGDVEGEGEGEGAGATPLATLPSDASAPANFSLSEAPKRPEPAFSRSRNTSDTSGSIFTADYRDTWHDEVPLRVVTKAQDRRVSI